MSVLTFPTNPSVNQTYTSGDKVYLWDGTVWVVVRTSAEAGLSAYEIAVRNGFIGTESEWLASLGGGGAALYTWIAYADNSTGTLNFSFQYSGQLFMGLALNEAGSTPTSDPTEYTWVSLGGDSSIQAFLTNESHVVAASSTGDVISYVGSGGTFKVFQGTNDVTAFATFSVINESGIDASIDTSGVYTIDSMTTDTATATFRASYNGVSIDRVYSIGKARAGAGTDAPVIGISPTAQAFTFLDGIANPTNQIITLTAQVQNLTGSISWTAVPAVTFSTSGDDGETISVNITDFGARTQVTFTATHDASGLSDRLTLFSLNQSSAEPGATQNQQFSTPYDPGVVTKPAPGNGSSGGFDSDAFSLPTISGDFILRFTPLENGGGGIVVALDDNPNASSPGSSPTDYSFVLGTSSLDAYVTGVSINSSTYAEGDILEIHRVGSTWSWWKNGNQVTISASGSTGPVGVRVTLQAVSAVVSNIQLVQGGLCRSLALTTRGAATATSLPAENARNEYEGSVKVLINGSWNIYATRNVHTGPWQSGYTYTVGDIFTFGGTTYMVKVAHLSTGTEPDLAKANVLAEPGPAGTDGLAGILSNESHIVSADADGNVESFADAGGTFRVFYGADEVTTGSSFTIQSQTGVVADINATTGVYTISSMTADNGTVVFTAQFEDGPILTKTYSIAKSRVGLDGSDPKLIFVTSDRQTITYDSAGTLNPSSQTTTFVATVQNSSATIDWTVKTISGTLLDASLYLSQTTGSSVTMTGANFNTARGATEGIVVTATIVDNGTYRDSISVVRVKQGANGTPGQDGLTGVLTNESHTVATATDGSGGDFTTAGGTFKVYKGVADYTTGQGVIYSVQSSIGVTISINSTTGVYTISGMSANQGTAVLRANYGGTLVDKTYSIVKSPAGAASKLLVLTSNRQTIAYDSTDTLIAGQDITLAANRQNSTATVNWTLKTISGDVLDPATYLSSTTGTNVTLTAANFNSARGATQGVVITATIVDGSTFSDSVSVIKVRDGIDGVSALTGFLTNEAHVLAADSDGAVSDFSSATGTFKLFHGVDDVTTSGAFTVASENNVDVSIDASTGIYSVASMTGDIGTAVFQATWSGITIQKAFSVVKSRAGADGSSPKLLSVYSDSQTVVYDSDGNPTPSSQTITFTSTKQNTAGTVNWTITDLNGVAQTPTTSYLSVAAGASVTMSETQFASARNSTGGIIVSGSITDGITLTDSVSVVRVASGATGTAGAAGIVGLLTNENHTVAADNAGVVSSFTDAGGIFKVFEGTTDVTGLVAVTYSVQSSTGVTISIDATGTYTVTAMSASTGTATLRAVYKGVNIDKIYTISKALAGSNGENAKILVISSDRQTITYGGDGSVNPATQTTTFTANKQNTTATVNWTIKKSTGDVVDPATYLSATSGDSVTLTAANFDTARGITAGLLITATITDGVTISDTVSLMKVQSGADGAGSVSGYLTNESHTVPTDGSGNSGDFTNAVGVFKVFNGTVDVSDSASYDIPTGGAANCTGTIDASTGAYSVTAMTADTATLTVRAQYSSSTITKVFSLSKSRAGAPGTSPKIIWLSSTHQTFRFSSSGTVTAQTTTITATRQNTSVPTDWYVYSLDGSLRLGSGAAALAGYFTVSGDQLTLTSTNFSSFCTAFSTLGMTVEGRFSDGSTYSDRVSIIKLSDGQDGSPGIAGKVFSVYSNRQMVSYTGTGALSSSSQDVVFNAVKQNTASTVNWTVTDSDGVAKTPVTNYLSSASGDSVTMTAAQFDTARASTTGVIVTATLVDGATFTDSISVVQAKAGTNAIVAFLTNETATVPADGVGLVNPSDLAAITGSFKIFQGTTDVSTGNSVSYSVNTQSGMTASINAATGAYTVNTLTAGIGTATLQATLPAGLGGGTVFKVLTVTKATAGAPSVNGYLTNDSVTLNANANGVVSDFSPASGTFRIFSATTDVTSTSTFSVLTQTGCTGTINATTGAYSVSAMSADSATLAMRAVTSATYGSVTIDKTLSLSKSKQGAQGPSITLTPTAAAFTYVDGIANPSVQTITITATLSDLAGPISWATTPNVASGTGTSFSVTSTQFNGSTHQQVVVTASVPTGETQSLVLYRLDKFSSTYLSNVDQTMTDTAQAKSRLDAMDNNNIITRREKKLLKRIIQAVVQEYPLTVAKAQTLGITTELTAYQSAYNALYNYASLYNASTNPTGTNPALLDQTADTPIVSATFDSKFDNYYSAQATLNGAMHLKASQSADWNNVGSVPTELKDGRVSTALDSSGNLVSTIPTSTLTNSNVLRRTGGGTYLGHLSATKGATLGTDTFDSDGTTVLSTNHLKNAAITVDSAGTITNIGTSGVVVDNTKQLWNQVTGSGKPADGATVNNVTYSVSAPSTPVNGDIWVDTSASPAKVRVRVSGAWQVGASNVTDTAHLTDGAGLGTKATWSNVTGSGRPADGATVNNVTYSSAAPASPANGDIWVDTSATPNVTRVRVTSAWQVAGNYTTATSNLTDDAGLGTKATWANVTGSGKPADNATTNNVTYSASAPATPVNGDIWVDTSTTPAQTKVRVAGSWQIGGRVVTDTGHLTDGAGLGTKATWANVTGSGKPVDNATANRVSYAATEPATPVDGDIWVDTSAGPRAAKIRVSGAWQVAGNYTTATSQLTDDAALGSKATWTNVTGAGKPEDNATAGATLGANLKDSLGSVLSDTQIKNSAITVDVTGQISGIGTAGVVVDNARQLWTQVTGSGKPADNATANRITYSSSAPVSPVDGDIWVDTTTSPNVTKVRVASAWQAAGNYTTDTAQLTDGAGLGTKATWTNVTSRPVELTDGRLAAAIDSSGQVQGTITATAKTSSGILSRTGGGTYTGDLNATNGGNLATNISGDLDDVSDGGTYGKIRRTQLSNGSHKLTVGGSGMQVGDQRNLPNVTAMNMQYAWPGTISYTATSTSASISVSACSVVIGSVSVSYNALSTSVSGSAGTTRTYFLYLDDPNYAGGTKALQTSTTSKTTVSSDGRVYVGQVTVTFPSSGTGTGGGTGGGSYSTCVASDAWVLTRDGLKLASEIQAGDLLRVLTDDCEDTMWELCTFNKPAIAYSYIIRSENDAELICADSTPITLRDGSCIYPAQVDGTDLPIWTNGKLEWQKCWAEPYGFEEVQHISCSSHVYAAGMDRDGDLIFTHNVIQAAKP